MRRTKLPDGLPTGEAVATPGFGLPARWVIHTVGPNRRAGQTDPALLRAAFVNSLAVARELGCHSVAFPAVSAGVYGWAIEDVATVAVGAARDAQASPGALELVRFVLFSEQHLDVFETEL